MTRKTIRLGDIELVVADPMQVQPSVVDLIVEARNFNDMIALSFATVITDGSGAPEAVVCARLRLTVANAIDLRSTLDTLLSSNVPKGQAN